MTGRTRGLVVCVAAAMILTGCASTAPDAQAAGELSGAVNVFAAASLTETFDELAAEFGSRHPAVDVAVNFGGSSGLAGQIVQGAPADVFAAADETTMRTVTDAGLAGDPTVFATNTLQLVTPAANPAGVTGPADIARAELAIALCSPEVPCGAATVTLLAASGVTASPDTLEQDVRAVLTKVQLDEADAGLVYRTDALAAGDAVRAIDIEGADAATNAYPIATLTGSGNARAARAFVDFVLSADGRSVLEAAGFGAP
jgi:molybdate transport system substrate-binding protein